MEASLCRICRQSDESIDGMQPIFGTKQTNQLTFQSKLLALGFLQAHEGDGQPSYLCGCCASRVDDAFEFKQQCEKSKSNFSNVHNTIQSVQKGKCNTEEIELAVLDLSFKSSNFFNQQSENVSLNSSNHPYISSILGCSRKMIMCLQKFSIALRKLIVIVNDALNFTTDIIDLVSNVSRNNILENNNIVGLKSQAEDWKTRSALIEESIGFVYLLTLAFRSNCCSDSALSPHSQSLLEYSDCHSLPETSMSSDTSGVMELWSDTSFSGQSLSSVDIFNSDCKEYTSDTNFCRGTAQRVLNSPQRRLGSDEYVQRESHPILPDYPSQAFVRELPSESKVSKELQDKPLSMEFQCSATSHILTSANHESLKQPHEDKKSKRKFSTSTVSQKNKKRKIVHHINKSGSSIPAPSPLLIPVTFNNEVIPGNNKSLNESNFVTNAPSEPSAAASFKCQTCGRLFESKQSLQSHLKGPGGCARFPCNYCEKEYSTAWNRTQHERCHTGLKPYVCDVCGESFRYNVTRRHHKSRVHAIKSEV